MGKKQNATIGRGQQLYQKRESYTGVPSVNLSKF